MDAITDFRFSAQVQAKALPSVVLAYEQVTYAQICMRRFAPGQRERAGVSPGPFCYATTTVGDTAAVIATVSIIALCVQRASVLHRDCQKIIS